MQLTDNQRLSWLRLIRSENVGPVAFRQLINRFGSADAALDALPELVTRGGARRHLRIATRDQAEREMQFAQRFGYRFIALGEREYPEALRAADAPPPLLAMKGSTGALLHRTVGIVGSRNASMAGVKMAERLARGLGDGGYTIASGLARGIDAAAHQASLGTGTVACMAGGLDKPFPPENVPLMQRIAEEGGAVVSEMPFGWVPKARDFPRRNRLIAGLSLGVVIVEAALRSGSLTTARLANEMGRLVFAVPGSPLDPRAAGTNGLIKQGCTLVSDVDDVLDALAPLSERRPDASQLSLQMAEEPYDPVADTTSDSDRDRLIEALGPTPVDMDELIAHVGCPAGVVHTVLLELELAGRLERHRGGFVSLVGLDT